MESIIRKNSKAILNSIGVLSLAWFAFDFILKIKYAGEYRFLWFCSLGLIMIGAACLLKKQNLLAFFISVAIIVQTQWMIDLAYNAFTGDYLTGNSATVFEAGHTRADFANSMRHLFMLPAAMLAFYLLPSPQAKGTRKIALLFSILVLPFSFFVTDESINLNCMRASCLGGIGEGIPLFPATSVIALMLASSILIAPLLSKWRTRQGKSILTTSAILFIIAIALTASSTIKYGDVAHYSCEYRIGEGARCEGIFFDYERQMSYAVVRLLGERGMNCEIEAAISGIRISQDVELLGKTQKSRVYLPASEGDQQVLMGARCT